MSFLKGLKKSCNQWKGVASSDWMLDNQVFNEIRNEYPIILKNFESNWIAEVLIKPLLKIKQK